MTEYMFDVLYWTWGTLVAVLIFGDYAWWLWVVVPLYTLYLLVTTFGSLKRGMAGLSGQGGDATQGDPSNRQQKMEKRGGQKVQYR